MAVIPATKISDDPNKVVYQWLAVSNGDTCEPVNSLRFDDPTLYVFGTFTGSPLISLHASPEVITTPTLFSLCTSRGVDVSLSASGQNSVIDQCGSFFKPVSTAGVGMSVNIYLIIR